MAVDGGGAGSAATIVGLDALRAGGMREGVGKARVGRLDVAVGGGGSGGGGGDGGDGVGGDVGGGVGGLWTIPAVGGSARRVARAGGDGAATGSASMASVISGIGKL